MTAAAQPLSNNVAPQRRVTYAEPDVVSHIAYVDPNVVETTHQRAPLPGQRSFGPVPTTTSRAPAPSARRGPSDYYHETALLPFFGDTSASTSFSNRVSTMPLRDTATMLLSRDVFGGGTEDFVAPHSRSLSPASVVDMFAPARTHVLQQDSFLSAASGRTAYLPPASSGQRMVNPAQCPHCASTADELEELEARIRDVELDYQRQIEDLRGALVVVDEDRTDAYRRLDALAEAADKQRSRMGELDGQVLSFQADANRLEIENELLTRRLRFASVKDGGGGARDEHRHWVRELQLLEALEAAMRDLLMSRMTAGSDILLLDARWHAHVVARAAQASVTTTFSAPAEPTSSSSSSSWSEHLLRAATVGPPQTVMTTPRANSLPGRGALQGAAATTFDEVAQGLRTAAAAASRLEAEECDRRCALLLSAHFELLAPGGVCAATLAVPASVTRELQLLRRLLMVAKEEAANWKLEYESEQRQSATFVDRQRKLEAALATERAEVNQLRAELEAIAASSASRPSSSGGLVEFVRSPVAGGMSSAPPGSAVAQNGTHFAPDKSPEVAKVATDSGAPTIVVARFEPRDDDGTGSCDGGSASSDGPPSVTRTFGGRTSSSSEDLPPPSVAQTASGMPSPSDEELPYVMPPLPLAPHSVAPPQIVAAATATRSGDLHPPCGAQPPPPLDGMLGSTNTLPTPTAARMDAAAGSSALLNSLTSSSPVGATALEQSGIQTRSFDDNGGLPVAVSNAVPPQGAPSAIAAANIDEVRAAVRMAVSDSWQLCATATLPKAIGDSVGLLSRELISLGQGHHAETLATIADERAALDDTLTAQNTKLTSELTEMRDEMAGVRLLLRQLLVSSSQHQRAVRHALAGSTLLGSSSKTSSTSVEGGKSDRSTTLAPSAAPPATDILSIRTDADEEGSPRRRVAAAQPPPLPRFGDARPTATEPPSVAVAAVPSDPSQLGSVSQGAPTPGVQSMTRRPASLTEELFGSAASKPMGPFVTPPPPSAATHSTVLVSPASVSAMSVSTSTLLLLPTTTDHIATPPGDSVPPPGGVAFRPGGSNGGTLAPSALPSSASATAVRGFATKALHEFDD